MTADVTAPGAAIGLTLPPAALDAIAERVAAALAGRLTPAGPEPWVGAEDVARHLGYPADGLDRGVRRVYDLKARGVLPHRKDGTRVLFHLSDVDRYLEEHDQ